MPTPTDDDVKLPPAPRARSHHQPAGSRKGFQPVGRQLEAHHADKVVALSPRRLGVRLRDALMLSKSTAGPSAVSVYAERGNVNRPAPRGKQRRRPGICGARSIPHYREAAFPHEAPVLNQED